MVPCWWSVAIPPNARSAHSRSSPRWCCPDLAAGFDRTHSTHELIMAAVTESLAAHRIDEISFGKIVQIREVLLRAQAKGARALRFESGDPSFAIAPHVLDAVTAAAAAGKTHYVPNDGIPELRSALAEKLRMKNRIADIMPHDVFL